MIDKKGMADRIRALRGDESRQKFGERFEMSRGHISHIEVLRRKPTLEFLLKLAKHYGITTDYLLTGKSPKKSPLTTAQRIKIAKIHQKMGTLYGEFSTLIGKL